MAKIVKEEIDCPNCGASISYAKGEPPRRCVGRIRVKKGTSGAREREILNRKTGKYEKKYSIACGLEFSDGRKTVVVSATDKAPMIVRPKTAVVGVKSR